MFKPKQVKAVILSIVVTVMTGSLLASPARAVDWNTCNLVWFQYSGGGFDGTGSAPGALSDTKVFGSNSSSAECQGYVGTTNVTMLESVSHTGQSFNFNIIGNYVRNNTSCSISVKLNGKEWISGTTHFEADTYQNTPGLVTGAQNLYIPNLTTSQKNSFKALADIGNNALTVFTNCPGYEQANINLEANLKIVQDSFNDFEGVSINDGAEFTNSRDVDVNLSFETGVIGQVMISNDGGFPSSQRQIFTYSKNTIPWKLNATRDERMVKTTYVKYKLLNPVTGALASTWSQTISDDIILDTTIPIIETASAADQSVSAQGLTSLRSVVKLQSVKINLLATDNKSGVGKVQYSTTKSASGAVTKTYSKTLNVSLNPTKSTIYLRVQDKAGNWSAWSTVAIVKKYSNCAALNKDYPGGVAKSAKVKNKGGKTKYTPKVSSSIYKANKTKDRDGDGIACER